MGVRKRVKPQLKAQSIGGATAMMSGLVILSRITGFFRTWAQAFALGTTLLSSCYTVANNLPNQLYELVMGGMIVTAFLPVYLSVKKNEGLERASKYVSNLLSIVFILMGAATVLAIIFASQLVFLQSAGTKQTQMDSAVYLFRFFAIEVLLYCLSSIVSGVLNAERDYFWSTAAPIFNNFITIASFIAYAVLQKSNPGLGLFLLALGNPLGVLVQVVVQLPSLHRTGIYFHWHVDWHDPALKDTLSIGVPTLIITACSFVTVSLMNSYALIALPQQGSAVQYYARLWYTLPYSVLSIPLTTAVFTELARLYADHNMTGYMKAFTHGAEEILFTLIPFMLYLIVFSDPLMDLLRLGAFSANSARLTAYYLRFLALALPFFGLSTFFQKVFSSLRHMMWFTVANIVASIVQVIFTVVTVPHWGIAAVALGSVCFFVVQDIWALAVLLKKYKHIGLRRILGSSLWGLGLGLAGALIGGAVMRVLTKALHLGHRSLLLTLVALAISGIIAVGVTFGLGIALGLPQTAFLSNAMEKKLHWHVKRFPWVKNRAEDGFGVEKAESANKSAEGNAAQASVAVPATTPAWHRAYHSQHAASISFRQENAVYYDYANLMETMAGETFSPEVNSAETEVDDDYLTPPAPTPADDDAVDGNMADSDMDGADMDAAAGEDPYEVAEEPPAPQQSMPQQSALQEGVSSQAAKAQRAPRVVRSDSRKQ